MQKRTGRTTKRGRNRSVPASEPYKVGLDERLKDPAYAAAYLNAAREEGILLLALRDVVEAHRFSNVAEKAEVNRESLYRALSSHGNPTKETFERVLSVVGLDYNIVPKAGAEQETRDKQYFAPQKATTKKRAVNSVQYTIAFPVANTQSSSVFPAVDSTLASLQSTCSLNVVQFAGAGIASLHVQDQFMNAKQRGDDALAYSVAPYIAAKLTGAETAYSDER